MDDPLSQLDERFLVLLFENGGIYPMYERWDLGPQALQQGQIIFWYSGQLNVGSKTLIKIMRRFEKKGLLLRKDVTRDRSPVMRYILTNQGMNLALQIREKYKEECRRSPAGCYMKVLTRVNGSEGIEQPLFAIKKGNILSIENVTIKKESSEDSESIITHGDTIIITVRKEKIDDAAPEILVKGLECDSEFFDKAKRYATLMLRQRGNYSGLQISSRFISLTPLPDDYLSKKLNIQQKTKRLLKEWKGHSPK
ncbi:MAG: hypothetical protein ACFFCD_06280 [Promethearchaeota archaeon]